MMEKQSMDITSDVEDPLESSVTVAANEAVDEACADWLQQHTIRVLELLERPDFQIAIRVVDDVVMTELHEKHSGQTGTTDVLTFEHSANDHIIVADIAICSCVAQRSASKRRHTLKEELLLYIVHGLLHCLNFDDHDEKSHSEMHVEEDRILTAIGIGKVWSSES